MVKPILFDRLYGRLQFPAIIEELLDCPGLLRLREVHMSSIPFMSFPSFASVNRFEHSVGVCHLARLASESLKLSLIEKTELMCASLYHDVATPPFAHVTEEVLEEFFGFDHEEQLRNLLTGKSEDLGMEKSQIYRGKGFKLQKVIQGEEGRKIGLDIFRIADMATGKGKFGPLVKGEVDLDNIDNVIRAATAMGIKLSDGKDAEALSRSFVLSTDHITLHKNSFTYLQKWQQTRFRLYDMIYGAVEDFSSQTMLKLAIRYLLETDSDKKFLQYDWNLTDQELINRINSNEKSSKIWERISLSKPFPCVGIFGLSGKGASSFLRKNMRLIEESGKQVFGIGCIANYTIDKRYRQVSYPLLSFLGQEEVQDKHDIGENIFLFFFSPERKKHLQKSYNDLALTLRKMVPSNLNLSKVKRIKDNYPHITEERLI